MLKISPLMCYIIVLPRGVDTLTSALVSFTRLPESCGDLELSFIVDTNCLNLITIPKEKGILIEVRF